MFSFRNAALMMIFLLATGCATVQPVAKSPEERVELRAKERHEALLARDFAKSYTFMSPGYRANNDMNQYKLDYAGIVNWATLQIQNAKCESERCEVNVRLEYRSGSGGAMRPSQMGRTAPLVPMVNTEIWIEVDNEWWFVRAR